MTDPERITALESNVAGIKVDMLSIKKDVTDIKTEIVKVDGMLDKVGNFLSPYLPWLKTVVAWVIIYISGYLTSHYGLPPLAPITVSKKAEEPKNHKVTVFDGDKVVPLGDK